MNIKIEPSKGEVKVSVIDGVELSHTIIEAECLFEVPSISSVIYIEPMKLGADVSTDPQQLSFDF
ncbi:MAG: hypothetical protein CMB99_00130 [Flavobacteriaceae bacterium]|nr:hypothetical protein [Flavobacteriaceae bacterium]|tara:strand:+ start:8690 stop:8884 length:195 start_codon:yes stop_codon:yes gene_type:complete